LWRGAVNEVPIPERTMYNRVFSHLIRFRELAYQ
jgi:hypothetical protein